MPSGACPKIASGGVRRPRDMHIRLHAERGRRARSIARTSLWFTVAVALGGCIYDADDRCSPGQVLYDEQRCICAEGSVLTATGCVACGENEVAAGSSCTCVEGFERPTPEAPCQMLVTGQGVDCDEASAPCTDATYNLCMPTSGTAGYCTSLCGPAGECEGGYACDTSATPPYCERPPLGVGRGCASDADCAGTEALLCESFMLDQCVVRDCDPAGQDCFTGYQCCDFTMFGAPATFCAPEGSC